MSYVKQNFVDGQNLYASQLNHMEDGIAAALESSGKSNLIVVDIALETMSEEEIIGTASMTSGEINEIAFDDDNMVVAKIVDVNAPFVFDILESSSSEALFVADFSVQGVYHEHYELSIDSDGVAYISLHSGGSSVTGGVVNIYAEYEDDVLVSPMSPEEIAEEISNGNAVILYCDGLMYICDANLGSSSEVVFLLVDVSLGGIAIVSNDKTITLDYFYSKMTMAEYGSGDFSRDTFSPYTCVSVGDATSVSGNLSTSLYSYFQVNSDVTDFKWEYVIQPSAGFVFDVTPPDGYTIIWRQTPPWTQGNIYEVTLHATLITDENDDKIILADYKEYTL